MAVSLVGWRMAVPVAMTESESLHSVNVEEQHEGLRFCLIKSQQQHLALPSPAAEVGLEH